MLLIILAVTHEREVAVEDNGSHGIDALGSTPMETRDDKTEEDDDTGKPAHRHLGSAAKVPFVGCNVPCPASGPRRIRRWWRWRLGLGRTRLSRSSPSGQ